MKKILIIQTAFIGDVVLATPLVEKLNQYFPQAKIDFLLRKGNENLLDHNPKINEVIIWNKKQNKLLNLLKLIRRVRKTKYDLIVNIHRYFSSGMIMLFSDAKLRIGFDKNPLSAFYSFKVKHSIGNGEHEVQRNLALIRNITDDKLTRPILYPSEIDYSNVQKYKTEPYICISPSSVWYTKQFPMDRWAELIELLDSKFKIYLLGGKTEFDDCEELRLKVKPREIINLAGKLSFLESTALMRNADMNYVNDSAPLHFASAINAKTTAIFCSTIPDFGFGPLADNSVIVQVHYKLSCRPCGLHGFKNCPENHFKCAMEINVKELLF